MTISIWRFCHLSLALVSCLFITLTAVTGIILAFEPIMQQCKPQAMNGLDTLTLARVLPVVKKTYPEIIDLKVENNRFVILNAIDAEGEQQQVYMEPRTGQVLGDAKKQDPFFKNVTSLHRSLFMHGLGRLFIGVSSLLLFLIAVSGIVLIIERQGGIKRFFSRLVKENFAQYYHVYLGRLFLIPVLIISLTGTYLYLKYLKVIPTEKISHHVNLDGADTGLKTRVDDFAIFKNSVLSNVQTIEFPFSEDPEDYFKLKLTDRELIIDQYSGSLLSEVPYTTSTLLSDWSMDLHTGRKSVVWALVLVVACINILFFIYSGFTIALKRRAGKIKRRGTKDNSKYVILVGSGNGATFKFANAVHEQLLSQGHSSYLTELNNYSTFAEAEHIIIMTSTRGEGNAPWNARKFLSIADSIKQPKQIKFSVVGFGSRAYPYFCRFAFEVYETLCRQTWADRLLDVHTVNDRSPGEFEQWLQHWSENAAVPISLNPEIIRHSPKHKQTLTVIDNIKTDDEMGTFLVHLKPQQRAKFQSGDLLAVYPANDYRERYYSLAKINKEICLSIRLHPGGLGSGYLHGLEKGQKIGARIVTNQGFHFPKRVKTAILISNGTGIAPFLGMIDQNGHKAAIHLYCGFRHYNSLSLYEAYLKKSLAKKKLEHLHIAYSREAEKQYVKDLLVRDATFVADTLKNNGIVMICGSLEMQEDVLQLLDCICKDLNGKSLDFYEAKKQVLMDCY